MWDVLQSYQFVGVDTGIMDLSKLPLFDPNNVHGGLNLHFYLFIYIYILFIRLSRALWTLRMTLISMVVGFISIPPATNAQKCCI